MNNQERFELDLAEIIKRAIKYLLEGAAVALAAASSSLPALSSAAPAGLQLYRHALPHSRTLRH